MTGAWRAGGRRHGGTIGRVPALPSDPRRRPIAVFDSGVGGLSVLRAVFDLLAVNEMQAAQGAQQSAQSASDLRTQADQLAKLVGSFKI